MTLSMTAFARQTCTTELGQLVWEMRSINHRYLEVTVRLPEELRGLEPRVREVVGQRLSRGKVECNLRLEREAGRGAQLRVNVALAEQIIQAAEQIEHLIHEAVPARTMDILRWPGVIEMGAQDLTPVEEAAMGAFGDTVGVLIETRAREGARLADTFRQRVAGMREQVAVVRERLPEVLARLRTRLRERLAEIAETVDHDRLEQEMVLAAQRLDLDEEIDRIHAHLDEVEATLKRKEPVGRRLDFLMQELNREANTVGSKASDLEITRAAVAMKVFIEQMREQVQNIE